MTGWSASVEVDQLAPALVAALGELEEVTRTEEATVQSRSGTYRYRYAGLADVNAAVRPVLARHQLAVMQATIGGPGPVEVWTTIMHTSGQHIVFGPLTLDGDASAQALGSRITYARRYSLLASLGIATEDDDGRAASKPPPPPADEDDPDEGLVFARGWVTQQLNDISDPERRRQVKREYADRFGVPGRLAIDDMDAAVAWVDEATGGGQ